VAKYLSSCATSARRQAERTVRNDSGARVVESARRGCRAALLLTGSAKAAEFAELSGIAALECGDVADNVVRVETATVAIQWCAKLPTQSAPALVQHPGSFSGFFCMPLSPATASCCEFSLNQRLGPAPRFALGGDGFGEKPCAGFEFLPDLAKGPAAFRKIGAVGNVMGPICTPGNLIGQNLLLALRANSRCTVDGSG
jgi:hypothetical protein